MYKYVSMETGLYKERQQNKITVFLDVVIIGDFYYLLYSSTLSTFSLLKILFTN